MLPTPQNGLMVSEMTNVRSARSLDRRSRSARRPPSSPRPDALVLIATALTPVTPVTAVTAAPGVSPSERRPTLGGLWKRSYPH